LDGGESLQRLILGFREGLSTCRVVGIEKIIFVILGEREHRMLTSVLNATDAGGDRGKPSPVAAPRIDHPPQSPLASSPQGTKETQEPFVSDSAPAANKKRVFVAMPFSEEFQNVYEFGIYPAVRNCGLICERVDESHFTGDILSRIRDGIESASLVIADLTEGRPNVYLEVGYAWGRGVPVIFVAKKGEKLHFDVSTHRCIFYARFTQFAKDLEELIRGIDTSRRT